jgi:hypothetical protein
MSKSVLMYVPIRESQSRAPNRDWREKEREKETLKIDREREREKERKRERERERERGAVSRTCAAHASYPPKKY